MDQTSRERLVDLLDHARRATSYFARRLPPPEQPLPEDVLAVLRGLEPLSRQDVRRHRVRLFSESGDPSTWRGVRSTGTTGEPVEVVLDDRARAAEAAVLGEHVDRTLGSDRWRGGDLIFLALHEGAMSRAQRSPWSEHALVIKWNLIRAWQDRDDRFVRTLEWVRDRVVTGLPSTLELIAARVRGTSMAGLVRPALVVISGEVVEPEARRSIEVALGCPVTSLYTISEAGILGTACPFEVGYHVEERTAFLEILDASGAPSLEGEVVATPLENRAMPLIRYRTGDRARWADQPCGCGHPGPRLILLGGRRPARLVSAAGASVNVVRFAKTLAGLDVDRFGFDQGPGGVVVTYQARRPLDRASRSVVEASVRLALGPETMVRVERVSRSDPDGHPPSGLPGPAVSTYEPTGPDPVEVARWLRDLLEGHPDLVALALTGSALDDQATSRFSDLDVAIFLRADTDPAAWVEPSRQIRGLLPRLSIHVDSLDELSSRAPLLACRLLTERLLVIGTLDEGRLRWPSLEEIRVQGRLWCQVASAELWLQLTRPDAQALEPIHTGWVAGKYALDALRYRELARGGRETASQALLATPGDEGWWADLTEALGVARERIPPPLGGGDAPLRYLTAALACVRTTAGELSRIDGGSGP
jgi:hypothetical protein